MRKFMFVSLGAILSMSLIGCGPAATSTVRQEQKAAYPAWFMNPPNLCTAATAKGATTHIARLSAVDKGRQELARQISTKVMGMLEQSVKNATGTGLEGAVGHEYMEGATRSLHKMALAGSVGKKYDFNTQSGEWMALVCLDPSKMAEAAKKAAQDAAGKLVDSMKQHHDAVVGNMDQQLDKHMGGSK